MQLSAFAKPILREHVQVGNNSNEMEVQELVNLLNKYRDTITMDISKLGRTDLMEMDIEIISASIPPISKPFRASQA